MTDKEEIKFAIRYLKKGLKSKRTPPLYEELMKELGFVSEKELGKVEGFLEDEKMEYIELENLKNNEIAELKAQINEMKDCENCKYKYIQDNADLGEGTRTDPCLSCRSHNMWEFEE